MTITKSNVRKSAAAGTFYPQKKEELSKQIETFFANVPSLDIDGQLRAIIVPHAGYFYSGQVAAYAFSLLRKFHFSKVVLLGPSHYVYLEEAVGDAHNYWETPLGDVELLPNDFAKISQAHASEHSLEVQLPFLQSSLKEFRIIPLVAGNADPEAVAKKILPLLDKRTLLVISSDLSHYHDYKMAHLLDHRTIKSISALDYAKLKSSGDACGLVPILAAMKIAARLKWKCKLLHYANSGDVSGDKAGVVGYASFALYD